MQTYESIKCIVFDFGFTLSSDLYFKVAPPECPEWHDIIQEQVFANRHVCRMWMTNALSLERYCGYCLRSRKYGYFRGFGNYGIGVQGS